MLLNVIVCMFHTVCIFTGFISIWFVVKKRVAPVSFIVSTSFCICNDRGIKNCIFLKLAVGTFCYSLSICSNFGYSWTVIINT